MNTLNILNLFILAVVIFAAYNLALVIISNKKDSSFRKFIEISEFPGIDEVNFVNKARYLASPRDSLYGIFSGIIKFNDEDVFCRNYFSRDMLIIRECAFNKKTYSAQANYSFVGGVMVFSDVVGDGFLFSGVGDVVEVSGDKITFMNYSRSLKVIKGFGESDHQ